MKKFLALILFAAMCILPAVQAESEAPGFPPVSPEISPEAVPEATPEAPGNASAAAQTMELTIDGAVHNLDYDEDPDFSFYDGEYIQACFFSYVTDDLLYEFFLIFPDSVVSGSELTPSLSGMDESAVMLYITTDSAERYAVASQFLGIPYPEGADYALRFDTVQTGDGLFTCSGSLDATLGELDEAYNVIGLIEGIHAEFSFSMALSDSPADTPQLPGSEAAAPEATIPPAPSKLVVPPNARKI